jgi:SAM-dependent methyltransferase
MCTPTHPTTAPAVSPPTIRDHNRRRYELFWRESTLTNPKMWPQWEVVQKYLGATNLELGPGPRPRLPVKDNYFLDISPAAVAHLQTAGGRAQVSDLTQPFPFPDGAFDLIAAFEVLEHLPNDTFVLGQIRRCLKPAGNVLVSFPLGQRYWTAYDAAIGHVRRYEVTTLDKLLAAVGLKIVAYAALPFPTVGARTGQLLARAVQKYPLPCLKVAACLYALPWPRWLKKIQLLPWDNPARQKMARASTGLFRLKRQL